MNEGVPLGDDYPLRSNGNSPLSHISSWFEMRVHGFASMRPPAAVVKGEQNENAGNITLCSRPTSSGVRWAGHGKLLDVVKSGAGRGIEPHSPSGLEIPSAAPCHTQHESGGGGGCRSHHANLARIGSALAAPPVCFGKDWRMGE